MLEKKYWYLINIILIIRNLFPDNIVQMAFIQYESKIVPKFNQFNKSFNLSAFNESISELSLYNNSEST